METLRAAVSRYPLTAFFILTYILSWWTFPIMNGAIFPYGPFLAAIIILAITQGRPGLSRYFRKLISPGGGWHWLLIGPALVLAYLLIAAILNIILGAAAPQLPALGALLPTMLTLTLMGGMWEEPGWTGYALPLLQNRHQSKPYGLLQAGILMGIMRGLWHLPLVISGAIPWYDAVFFSMALQFLISWLYNRSGGNVLAVMLLHLTSNIAGGAIMVPAFSGADQDQYYWLFIITAWLLALPLVAGNKWSMGRRASPKPGVQFT